MTKINLLNWREEFRREKKQEFIQQTALLCVVVGILCFLWVAQLEGDVSYQKQRNSLVNKEISSLNEQVDEIQELKHQRAELISRMKIIQDLQGTRPVIVRYFDELSRTVPDGLYVTQMSRKGEVITLEGEAESNSRVASFMRNIDNSEWFGESNLNSVTANPEFGEQAVSFSVVLKTVLQSKDSSDEK